MEIINQKVIKKFIWTVSTITFIFIAIPVGLYFIEFHHGFSDSKSDWGTFGDFIGGIVGTLFGLIAVIFSIISVYITLKVATRIQEFEAELNSVNADNENKKFEKEVNLTHQQNKPLPFLNLIRFPEKTEITICNYGIGPLIIKSWELEYDGKIHKNFNDLLSKHLKSQHDQNEIALLLNTSQNHVITPAGERVLFKIEALKKGSRPFHDYQKECRDFFERTQIHFEYEDIFENKYLLIKKLNFLRN